MTTTRLVGHDKSVTLNRTRSIFSHWMKTIPYPLTREETEDLYTEIVTTEVRNLQYQLFNRCGSLAVNVDDDWVFYVHGNNRKVRLDIPAGAPIPVLSPQNHIDRQTFADKLAMRPDSKYAFTMHEWLNRVREFAETEQAMATLVDRALASVNTAGQLYRMWPGVSVVFNNKEKTQAYSQQARRSPLPTGVTGRVPAVNKLIDLGAFKATTEQLEHITKVQPAGYVDLHMHQVKECFEYIDGWIAKCLLVADADVDARTQTYKPSAWPRFL